MFHLGFYIFQINQRMNLSKLSQSRQLMYGLFTLVLCTQVSSCAWLDQRLRQATFRPTPASESDRQKLAPDVQVYLVAAKPGVKEPLNDTSSPQLLSFLYFPASDLTAPTVLYLHGVFRNAIQNQPKIQAIRQAGFNVLALDYRGWGLSSHTLPSEESVTADALVGLDELFKREPRASQRIVFGHSMGGAVATALVSRSETSDPASLGGLVLESTFASARSLTLQARWYGFIALPFIGNSFDSSNLIGKINSPIWMMHGASDTVVPIEQGQKLARLAPKGTAFEVFENGQHSDLHRSDPTRYKQIWQDIGARISAQR
jgi:uncharacterized protein